MNESQTVIKGLLALTILIPLFTGALKFRTADLISRLFVFFLLLGLTTDLTMWFMIHTGNTSPLLPVFNVYSLLEALFFFWFLQATIVYQPLRTIARVCLFGTVPFWLFSVLIYPYLAEGNPSRNAPFDAIYEIVVSFIAGFALLQLVEKEDSVFSNEVFWFTLGIFFYCFCTFFIMSFLQTNIGLQIWFLNNIINIISYSFYTLGFARIRKRTG